MTDPTLVYRATPDHPALVAPEECDCFPIHFIDDPDYFRVDRVAGFWLSLGLTVIVEKTSGGYRLTLDHPEAVLTQET